MGHSYKGGYAKHSSGVPPMSAPIVEVIDNNNLHWFVTADEPLGWLVYFSDAGPTGPFVAWIAFIVDTTEWAVDSNGWWQVSRTDSLGNPYGPLSNVVAADQP
jgi:hypothetical protein